MTAIGIDLGTTNSLVALVEDGAPLALLDTEGRALLPSAVSYGEAALSVGWDALDRTLTHPTDTLTSIKRLMGRSLADVEGDTLGTLILEQDGHTLRVRAGGGLHSPVEISAEILRRLVDRAETHIKGPAGLIQIAEPGRGAEPLQAVITVPAYFDDAQRQATRQAGQLAGLRVLRLLNEPTAAALAYGLEKKSEGYFAIFDLGGGTFDISILHLIGGVFEVMATAGDTALGGDDFDRAVALLMLAEAGVDPSTADATLRRRAVEQATRAKIQLTDAEETLYTLELPGGPFERRLSRADFTQAIQPILDRVRPACRRAMKDAGLRAKQLDGVVLVGGSTRSPVVRDFVEALFKRAPLGDIDPDQVVALGAAIQADLLASDSTLRKTGAGDILLLDVLPLSLGLETMGGVVERIIPRNSQIPASRAQEFTTYADGQTAMDVHVVQGERDLVEQCRSLARFRLEGIPPRGAGNARVRVTFQVDADGILSVSARELSSGVEQTVRVEPTQGLTDAQVEDMLRAALDNAETDVAARAVREAQVDAERVIIPLRKALEIDGDLLTGDERPMIEAALADLEAAIKREEAHQIQDLTTLLDRISGGFAQRRMQRALQTNLVERKVNIAELESEMADAPVGGGEHA